MTRMTGPDCAVMCNLINTHTHTHTHAQQVSLIHPWEDQREWHRMTRMTGPDEGFNDWGGRGYDDFVPGEVTKTAPSGGETT